MKRHFIVLDGCRGIAALIVAVTHGCEWLALPAPPFAFLALDFFFMLSGFVIAHAYGERLERSGALWPFVKARLIRLHPMLVLGMVLGVLQPLAWTLASGSPPPLLVTSILFCGLLLMPLPSAVPGEMPHMSAAFAFPLNGPLWSMFGEYGVNLGYAAVARFLSTPVLVGVLVASAVADLWMLAAHGTLSIGFLRFDIHLALVRVAFPFFFGVALHRLYLRGIFSAWRCPAWLPGAALAVVLLLPGIVTVPAYCIAMLFVGLPLIVVAGIVCEGDAPAPRRMSALLGEVSYPMYVLHAPLFWVFRSVVIDRLAPGKIAVLFPIAVTVAIAVAMLASRAYDQPVRRWLTRRFQARPSHAGGA